MGHAGHNACAIASIGLVAHTAAMLHATVHGKGILQDSMAGSALDVTDKTNAAAVFLVGWIVKPMLAGQVAVKCQCHKSSQYHRDPSGDTTRRLSCCRLLVLTPRATPLVS